MGLENGANQANHSLIGKHIGLLTILSIQRKSGRTLCDCMCDCGNRHIVRKDHLLSGKIVSCGCYQNAIRGKSSVTHGMSQTRLYKIWKGMINRCRYDVFTNYKGRGITVCDEWQSFETFYEWAMTHGYRDDLSIDRIDNNGDYSPLNCRWANRKEQALNRRSNAFITCNGVTRHISEWDKDIGAAKSGRVRTRLNAGWSVEKAVTIPVVRRDSY